MILALVLLLGTATPAAPAATPPPTGVYRTEIRARFQATSYTGVLKLRIASGYVNGTYRADSAGAITPVSGGTDGTHIWLDLATLGGLHVEARFEGGKIVGIGSARYGRERTWIFTATPSTP